MRIVPFSESRWSVDSEARPTDALHTQHLLEGVPGSNDNFILMLAWARGTEFHVPRHRHNFEQVRLALKGDLNLGALTLPEGHFAYFSEGTPYGPQDDPKGDRVQVVVQFGGASGYGYMSIEQRRKAWREMSKTGKFIGPRYYHADGRMEWAMNADWRHVFGTELKYPRPRYKDPVIVNPRSFHWLPLADTTSVDHKFMGSFTERGVWVEKIHMSKGASWTSIDPRARRIFTVLSGAGDVEDQHIGKFAALQVDPGENLSLSASEDMELFLVGLPPIETPAVESDQYDTNDEQQYELRPA